MAVTPDSVLIGALPPAGGATKHRKGKRAIIKQENPNDELAFYSWEPCQALADYNHKYLYDESAGRDVAVYVIDHGANLNSVRAIFV